MDFCGVFLLYLANKSKTMHKIYLNGDVFEVNFDSIDTSSKGVINGQDFELDLAQRNDSQYHLIKDNKSYCIDVLKVDYESKEVTLKINGQTYDGKVENDLDVLLKKMGIETKSKSAANELRAPMPGMVLSVNIEKGKKNHQR
jgi:acetyl/propionyl-CoA carboxylase alpha subunit